jgi:hypothetical protein
MEQHNMADETQAVSSPAEVADPFKGEQPSLAEFTEYREKGTLPERFKPAEPAGPAPATETETSEPAPGSEPDDDQELKPKTAKRIKQLLDRIKELERPAAEKTDVKTESSPVKADPATGKEPTPDDLNADGSPKWKTYEEFTRALARYEAKQERAEWEQEQATKAAQKALRAKLDDARTRYKDSDEVIFPTEKSFVDAKLPASVTNIIGLSDVYVDLLYVIGSDDEARDSFIALAQSNPRAAIAKVFEYERGIAEALAKPRDENGQFVAPEKKKTSAPKPPAPVGGASSKAFDASDDSLSADEWMRKRNEEVSRRT